MNGEPEISMTGVEHTTLKIPRQRLPNRRENETIDLVFDGHRYHVTIGFAPDGRPGEVFCHGGKVGSGMDLILDDACVALSLLLQHGIDPQGLAHSMGRLGDGAAASIIGALVDLVQRFDVESAK